MSALITIKSSLASASSPHRLLPHQHIHALQATVFMPFSIGSTTISLIGNNQQTSLSNLY